MTTETSGTFTAPDIVVIEVPEDDMPPLDVAQVERSRDAFRRGECEPVQKLIDDMAELPAEYGGES